MQLAVLARSRAHEWHCVCGSSNPYDDRVPLLRGPRQRAVRRPGMQNHLPGPGGALGQASPRASPWGASAGAEKTPAGRSAPKSTAAREL